MKKLKKILSDWNYRFDTTVEPNRFLYMLIVAAPGILLMFNDTLWLVGLGYVVTLIVIRHAYLTGKLN